MFARYRPLSPDLGDQFVGQRTTVRQEDISAEPGVQTGEGPGDLNPEQDDPEEKRTGNKEPQRNAPPGRQDRNGKGGFAWSRH